MSGFAVWFGRDGQPADRDAVADMIRAVPYRGPDGMAVWTDSQIGLGFAKMAVAPESEAEMQPLHSRRTGCSIVADARLDNREVLIDLLGAECAPTASDAEILLRAYEEWGGDGFPRLLGDYAFAIWDPRDRSVVCARDTSGQRSLYYRADDMTFAAASEIHQLLQDPRQLVQPNENRILQSLVPLYLFQNEKDTPETYYDGIWSLPAGCFLRVDAARLRVDRYWSFRPPAEIRHRTDAEYAEHFLSLFSEAVRSRLRTRRPVGVLLSGGLDSGSVACTAHALYRSGAAEDHGFKSFSSVFPGLDSDESAFIEDMQRQFGFEAECVPATGLSGRLQLNPEGFRESPNMGISSERNTMLARVSDSGVRVLLTGDVADACVMGSRQVFDSLLKRGDLSAFWRHFRAFRRAYPESLRATILYSCVAPLLPMPLEKRLMSFRMQRKLRANWPYFAPNWMEEGLKEHLTREHMRLCLEMERDRLFANEARELEYRMLYPPATASHLVPWPVEVARPFADRRLHEFLLAIPPEQKFEPHSDTDEFYAGSKRVLRNAMTGILPERVRTRTSKTTFMAVLEQEFVRNWEAYESAFGPEGDSKIVSRGYVDRSRFWSKLRSLRDGDPPGGDLAYVSTLVDIETWLRRLAQPRPGRVSVSTPIPGDGAYGSRALLATADAPP